MGVDARLSAVRSYRRGIEEGAVVYYVDVRVCVSFAGTGGGCVHKAQDGIVLGRRGTRPSCLFEISNAGCSLLANQTRSDFCFSALRDGREKPGNDLNHTTARVEGARKEHRQASVEMSLLIISKIEQLTIPCSPPPPLASNVVVCCRVLQYPPPPP